MADKKSRWTYHRCHSYKDGNGEEINFQSQLYKVGVYGIFNNDPAMQIATTPAQIVILEKKLKKQEKDGKISDLVLWGEITVSNETGFFEEVK